jgi:hypothetical protein
MPERQGWRALLVGLMLALAGPAGAETPTSLAANKPEPEKRRDPLTETLPSPRARPAVAPPADERTVSVRHLDQIESGWSVAETVHFRVYYTQDRALAEQAAVAAERAYHAARRKWLGEACSEWERQGQILLYPTARTYSDGTGAPLQSPGHSEIRAEGARVVMRRIYVHTDDPGMIKAVLPHEVTHTVLAGQFGDQPVPRWADEGMAVLDEPQERIDSHLRALVKKREEGPLFTARELIGLKEYPERRRMTLFYAQSVSLTDFLTKAKDARTLARFVRDSQRDGYETSLRRYYGWDLDELDRRWRKHAFHE